MPQCSGCVWANPIFGAPVPGQPTQFRCQRSTPEKWRPVFDTDYCGFFVPGAVGPPAAFACSTCTHAIAVPGVTGGLRCQRQLPPDWTAILPADWCGEYLSMEPPVPLVTALTYLTSQTLTVPPGVTSAVVELVGGGAGSSGGSANGNAGSAGGYVRSALTGLVSGLTLTLTVGLGGARKISGTPNPGGDTRLDSGSQPLAPLVAGGGFNTGVGGLVQGGTASGGDLNIQGGNSWCGLCGSDSTVPNNWTLLFTGGNPLSPSQLRVDQLGAGADYSGRLYGGGGMSGPMSTIGADGKPGCAFISWYKSLL